MISTLTRQTLSVLGHLIQVARQERAFSQAALAERLHVSRQTVIAIEKGSQQVSIGTVLEAAHVLGIPLFSADREKLSQWQSVLNGFSGFLPKRARNKKQKVRDDF